MVTYFIDIVNSSVIAMVGEGKEGARWCLQCHLPLCLSTIFKIFVGFLLADFVN